MNWVTSTFESILQLVGEHGSDRWRHDGSDEVIQVWQDYLEENGSLPPLLVAETGWIVNGHHRFETTAKEFWATVVHRQSGKWVTTGRVALVRKA